MSLHHVHVSAINTKISQIIIKIRCDKRKQQIKKVSICHVCKTGTFKKYQMYISTIKTEALYEFCSFGSSSLFFSFKIELLFQSLNTQFKFMRHYQS